MQESKTNVITPEDRFANVVQALGSEPGVTPPAAGSGPRRAFGSNGLKVDNRIFAMLVRGNLVVKLPRERVTALIASGNGDAYDAGKGRPMKEWLTVRPTPALDWIAVAREALEFGRTKG